MLAHQSDQKLQEAFSRYRELETSWAGYVYRVVGSERATVENIPAGIGARINGGRWNAPKSFPTVYASLHPLTAQAEFLEVKRQVDPSRDPTAWNPEKFPNTMAALKVKLERVIDLHDSNVRERFGFKLEDILSEDWKNPTLRPTLSQRIGQAAHDGGLSGLIVTSAADPRTANIAMFPLNFRSTESVLVIHNTDRLLPQER